MKHTYTIAVALLVVFLTSGSAVAAPLSKTDDAAVRKLVADIEKSWNTHDMKLLATLFREDAEFVNVVGLHWRGRDAIVKAHAVFHETMFKDCRLKTDSIQIRSIGPENAIAVVTTTQDRFTTPDGHVMPKGQTKQTYVFEKGSDGWTIVHGQNVRIDAEAVKNDPVNAGQK